MSTPGYVWRCMWCGSIRAVNVITVLEAFIARYAAPERLLSNNGPEFITCAIHDWLEKASIKAL